jgi:putative DNA primase/helicase
MADAARWITAAEPALPITRGAFLTAYEVNRNGAADAAIDFSKVGLAVIVLMQDRVGWLGNSAELLAAIAPECNSEVERQRAGWPKNAKAFNTQMRRIAPTLESRGLKVTFGISDAGRKRLISITNGTVQTGQPSGFGSGSERSDGVDGLAGKTQSEIPAPPPYVPGVHEDDVVEV